MRTRAKLPGSNLQCASCHLRRTPECSQRIRLDSLVQIRDEILWILDTNRDPAAISHSLHGPFNPPRPQAQASWGLAQVPSILLPAFLVARNPPFPPPLTPPPSPLPPTPPPPPPPRPRRPSAGPRPFTSLPLLHPLCSFTLQQQVDEFCHTAGLRQAEAGGVALN